MSSRFAKAIISLKTKNSVKNIKCSGEHKVQRGAGREEEGDGGAGAGARREPRP